MYNGAYYLGWSAELVRRVPAASAQTRHDVAGQIEQVCLGQFLLFRQARRLKEHARAQGVRLIGDLPFSFLPIPATCGPTPSCSCSTGSTGRALSPGVPPDYFSVQGQLWGNPVYDWDVVRETGYRWCIDRFRSLLAHVDMIRLDHFRGFAAAWHLPFGAAAAQTGQWVTGPGAEFFSAVQRELGGLPFIAEDLGLITQDVCALRDRFHLPGVRVLQFAFDGHSDNPHLPDNYIPNTVVYAGTHGNPPTREWYEELPAAQQRSLGAI